ncbi:MAG: CoxG family protein [Caulobacterales bacterium]
MQQAGEYRIGAPIDAVWRALNDPDVLARCIDGCEAMTKVGDDAFAATVKAKVGPLSATFTGEIKLTDLNPPRSYTLEGSVKGGAAGFGKGTAKVSLSEDGAATLLRYEVEGSVGGKLAQVGQRLIDGAARKMADDFFASFGEIVAPGASEKTPAPETAPSEPRVGSLVVPIIVVAVVALAALIAMIVLR